MNELIELFIVFFKLGAFTIGGGIAMLPLLQNTLIEEKKWFTKEEFVDIVAVCQSLPGIVAINMATYVGYKKKGLIGSIISTLGVTIPSFVLILIIAHGITSLGDNSIVMGAMAGLRAAALGLVVVAIIQLAPAAVRNKWALAAAVLAFVLIAVFNINTAYVILLFLVLGIAASYIGGHKAASASKADAGSTETPVSGKNAKTEKDEAVNGGGRK
ncbi:MAG: chromate transporter [Mogibacterium sp.]|nr:chromate transporter [Mogibacterium sp.]